MRGSGVATESTAPTNNDHHDRYTENLTVPAVMTEVWSARSARFAYFEDGADRAVRRYVVVLCPC